MPVSRRLLLTGSAGIAAAIGLSGATPAFATAPDRVGNLLARGRSFPDGVASGGVSTTGATLWTRIAGGGASDTVQLLVSENADLSAPLLVREVAPDAGGDGTVHAAVSGGRPGTQYFYGFQGADTASAVGRFRTARPADSAEPTRIGFFTCQSYVDGYFGALGHLAAEDLDLVVCLGDYIYENGGIGPGGRIDPIGLGVLDYIGLGWLADYRAKYRLYRTDPALRALHAAHAMLPVYDDHEVRNDWWRDGVDGRTALVPFRFEAQKRGALRAWSESMPVPLATPTDHPVLRQNLRLGRHLELFGYDSRSFRDAQPCGLVGVGCGDADNPGRTLLGADQKRSLLAAVTGSAATWKLLVNQDMMMNMVVGDGGARAGYDSWDGYGAERTEILSTLAASGRNHLVVTGDDHNSYAGELWDTGAASTGTARAGVEFVVPSVTSANAGDLQGVPGARAEEQNRLARNAHLKKIDMVQHGYGVLTVTGDEATFAFRQVDRSTANPGVRTSAAFTVAAGEAQLDAAV